MLRNHFNKKSIFLCWVDNLKHSISLQFYTFEYDSKSTIQMQYQEYRTVKQKYIYLYFGINK